MARKAKVTKAPEIKETVKAAPADETKEPAKPEVKAEPKKPGRKPAVKKAATNADAEKHDIVRVPDEVAKDVKITVDVKDEPKVIEIEACKQGKMRRVIEIKEPDKKVAKEPGRKSAANTKEEAKTAATAPVAKTKDATKKAGRKTAAKKEAAPVKSKADTAPKKAGRKPATKKTADTKPKAAAIGDTSATIKVQFGGAEYDIEAIKQAVEADCKANVKGRVKTLEIYVKPEDHAVYYVANSDAGHKIDL